MLNESEKKHIIYLWKCGQSYPEIAQEILEWRNHFPLIELKKDIKTFIKERNQ